MKRPMIVFIFLLGMVCGAVVSRLCGPLWRPKPPRPEEIAGRMGRELGLDADQQKQLEKIFKEEEPRMAAFHRSVQDQFASRRQEVDGRIASLLRPDQRARFEAFKARMRDEMSRHGPMPPPLADR